MRFDEDYEVICDNDKYVTYKKNKGYVTKAGASQKVIDAVKRYNDRIDREYNESMKIIKAIKSEYSKKIGPVPKWIEPIDNLQYVYDVLAIAIKKGKPADPEINSEDYDLIY